MENGFDFELYGTIFKNCFIERSTYSNGNLQLSLFGVDPATDEVAHFVDISLEQNTKIVGENEIVVDCKYRPTFISQLKKLGILKEQTGICVIFDMIYPIYTVDFSVIKKNAYQLQELLVA